MNKDILYQINKIEKEIKMIDSFLSNYDMKPRRIKLALFKRIFTLSLRTSGYGFLPQVEYKLPYDLNDEMLKVVKEYREKLIIDQKELWGT